MSEEHSFVECVKRWTNQKVVANIHTGTHLQLTLYEDKEETMYYKGECAIFVYTPTTECIISSGRVTGILKEVKLKEFQSLGSMVIVVFDENN